MGAAIRFGMPNPGAICCRRLHGKQLRGWEFYRLGAFGTTNLQALAGYNAFVAKYAPGGQIIWARQLGAAANSADATGRYNYPSCLKVAADGSIFVAGAFETPFALFDSFTLTNVGSADIFPKNDFFLAKLDSAGSVLWVNGAGGIRDDTHAMIAVDPLGNSYLTANWESPTLMLSGITLTNSSGSSDMLFCKYDPAGHLDWVRQTTGNSEEYGAVALDPVGNIYTAGTFRSIDLRLGTSVLNAQGTYHVFVAKLETTARPALSAARSTTKLVLSWNMLFAGYHLETSSECCNPGGWLMDLSTTSTNGGNVSVAIPLASSPRFFRLAKP
jgi:hypothetical protein